MKRFALSALAILSSVLASGVYAADYGIMPDLRPAYPDQWQANQEDPLRFEAGLRYWYSRGGQQISLNGDSLRTDDTSHILEGHFRIEDDYTSSFLKGSAGYAFATYGVYTSSLLPGEAPFAGGHIGYVGSDFGYMPFGNDTVRVGALAGYQYMKESPDKARADVFQFDGLNVHALRLGVTAKAALGTHADITAEVVGIPYAWVNGNTPNYVIPTQNLGGIDVNRVTGELNGSAYGASGELMLGLHPTENLTVRLGGRGWFLTGPTTTTLNYTDTADASVRYTESSVLDGLSLFRYGGLLEVTGRF